MGIEDENPRQDDHHPAGHPPTGLHNQEEGDGSENHLISGQLADLVHDPRVENDQVPSHHNAQQGEEQVIPWRVRRRGPPARRHAEKHGAQDQHEDNPQVLFLEHGSS